MISPDLREQLQSTLSPAYAIEGELAGGGMSRVFVATERSLGRRVVIKVLPPELAVGVSVERFKREIQLAAQLTHPHIVPVHAAGETNGLPYYTMPLVEGSSLRARLTESGVLPVGEAVAILRDVAKALAYAHGHGVLHRDIKPDNVLLAAGSAVVTDFGIAKAIAAARTEPATATLTQIGSTMGTPGYMAPEQAAADPGTDHRADIYAFGVMAYELLSGRRPFEGSSPHRLLASQMGEPPTAITELRPETPSALADLVARCLDKDADGRPQTAADLVRALDTVTSGGGHPAMPGLLSAGRPRLVRALGMWAAAFLMVATVARASVIAIGLPDWVFPGTLVVMLLGLPAILLTHFVQRGARRAMTATMKLGSVPTEQSTFVRLAIRASPHLSWRRTAFGGVYALGLFSAFTAGFMMLRALGIGPAGSLLAAGKLSPREPILVADFESVGPDTTLGTVVAEAVRTDLSQSSAVSVVSPATVVGVLRRMQRPADTRVDLELAREIALREGLKAIVAGEIRAIGGGFLLSVRLVGADSAQELAAFRAAADGLGDLIPTIGKLSRALRGKIGESLKEVRASAPLEQVTTRSLPALRKYAQAMSILDATADVQRFTALMEEAISLDSGFAMAYRKLGIELANRGGREARAAELLGKAYEHRMRLTEFERLMTIGTYYTTGPAADNRRALDAYLAAIQVNPGDVSAVNNAGVMYSRMRMREKAAESFERALSLSPSSPVAHTNLAGAYVNLGRPDTARQILDRLEQVRPGQPRVPLWRAVVQHAQGSTDSAIATLTRAFDSELTNATTRELFAWWLYIFTSVEGRVGQANRWAGEARRAQGQRGAAAAALGRSVDMAWISAWRLDQKDRAVRLLDSALAREPLANMAVLDRPYDYLAVAYSVAGRPDKARALLDEAERNGGWSPPYGYGQTVTDARSSRNVSRGWLALAERRYQDAAAAFRAADETWQCPVCALPTLAIAYDLGGNVDSAIAIYTRFVETPYAYRIVDGEFLADSHKRLGELWEQQGDRQRALGYYLRFVDLWKNADRELQPVVGDVRRRIMRLRNVEGR